MHTHHTSRPVSRLVSLLQSFASALVGLGLLGGLILTAATLARSCGASGPDAACGCGYRRDAGEGDGGSRPETVAEHRARMGEPAAGHGDWLMVPH